MSLSAIMGGEMVREVASALEARDTCGPNPCEKSFQSKTFVLPIVLGITIPLLGAAIAFIILARRGKRKQKEEDERMRGLDFGLDLDEIPNAPGKTGKVRANGVVDEVAR